MAESLAKVGKPTSFRLRFPEQDIEIWANRYDAETDAEVEHEIAPAARHRGFLTRPEFIELCHWKSPRTQSLVKTNSAALVESATRAALESRLDYFKIGILLLLRGVSWPTASVVLHFCDRGDYPILDFRALWSLGYTQIPTYTIEFWSSYTDFTRDLATRTGQSMRVVDRALWQYSKVRQRA